MANDIFKFYSQGKIGLKEANIKGKKKYYVEGYASTSDEDLAGEVISASAQESMMKQFRNRNITIDVEHEEWYDSEGKQLDKPKSTKIPVAKIIEAKKTDKGTWVKAELNSNIERFKEVWGSIKDGFLNAFSIAFYPIRQAGNVIDDLNIINVTMTGTPVNPEAKFEPVMKSAVAYLKSIEKESEPMTEEQSNTEQVVQEQPAQEQIVKEQPQEQPVQEQSVKEQPAQEQTTEDNGLQSEEDIKKQETSNEETTPEQPTTEDNTQDLQSNDSDISDVVKRVMEEKFKEFEKKLNINQEDSKTESNDTKSKESVEEKNTVPLETDKPQSTPLSMIKAINNRKNKLYESPCLKAVVEHTPTTEVKESEKKKSPLKLI